MANPMKENKLTDDKEKLKTVPGDSGGPQPVKKGEHPGMTRREQLESPETLGDESHAGGGGRAGGKLAQDVGTRDEMKRAMERPAGTTRVRKGDEREVARRASRHN